MSDVYKVVVQRKSTSSDYFFNESVFEFSTLADAKKFSSAYIFRNVSPEVYRARIEMETEFIYSKGYSPETGESNE